MTLTVHKMNERYNLEVLLSNHRDDSVGSEERQAVIVELFKDLLLELPEPPVAELKVREKELEGRGK